MEREGESEMIMALLFLASTVYTLPVASSSTTRVYVDPPSIVDPTLTPGSGLARASLENVCVLICESFVSVWLNV